MDEFEKGLFAEPYIHYASFYKGYNKALDDFVNTVKATFPHDNIAICNTEVIAEKLKEGGENE